MYLAFIDESGTIQQNDPQSNYYILTSVVMQEKGMKFLHQKTQDLKKEIWNIVQGPNKLQNCKNLSILIPYVVKLVVKTGFTHYFKVASYVDT